MKSILNKFMSVSMLDQHTQFLTGYVHNFKNAEEYTPQMFVDGILKRTPPNFRMLAGTAFHKMFEDERELDSEVLIDGWKILCDIDVKLSYPAAKEVSISKEYNTIPLYGRVDAMSDTTVHDIKTTSAIDLERYEMSFQWKAYLDMTGKDKFIYNLFLTDTNEVTKTIKVKKYDEITFHRYPRLSEDVKNKVLDYRYLLTQLEPMIIKTANENNIKLIMK